MGCQNLSEGEEMTKLYQALFQARQQLPPIPRNKTGRTGNQSYKYSDLGDILELVNPRLWASGLFVTQPIIGSELVTKIVHAESGESESYPMALPACGDIKEYGALITYFRRYAICAALGVVTEEDTDGVDHKQIVPSKPIQAPSKPFRGIQAQEQEEMPEWLQEPPPPFTGSKNTPHAVVTKTMEMAKEFPEPEGLDACIVPFGKNKGLTFKVVGPTGVANDRNYWATQGKIEKISARAEQFINEANQWLGK